VAWIDGEVEKINGQEVVIQATTGKKVQSSITEILTFQLHTYSVYIPTLILYI